MEVDYPAAHSTDTHWYAVDSAGHVAVFWTGENGHLPVNSGYRDESELMEHARQPGAPDHPEQLDPEEGSRYLGVYMYSYADYHLLMYQGVVPAYLRDLAPKEPLHIDQLPPHLRAECGENRFDTRFDQTKSLQPLEFVECTGWNPSYIAYLCGDGKTVRPARGHESEFAAFVQDLCKREPEATKGVIFDGPKE
jgi:hypothetical protein